MSTHLYEKRGRRYIPWGNGDHWGSDRDAMQIGSFRLIHCPAPGHYRQRHDVAPDTAAFIAAVMVAQHAMEEAMNAAARAQPSVGPRPYTAQQIAIIDRFRADMAAAGALVPSYWVHGTAAEIALAGIKAVERLAKEGEP